MSKSSLTNIRARRSERDRINKIARELSVIQEEDVKTPEVLKRMANIPNIRNILIEDAKIKRKLRGRE